MSLAQRQYQIRELFPEQTVFFCYSGYMTEGILGGLGQAIKQKLAQEQADTNTTNTVFSIFVEQMQNVIRYSAEREPLESTDEGVLSHGTLTLGRDAAGYFVICGNKISRDRVEALHAQLSAIQQLDRTGLKSMYKQILKGEIPEGSKGAGVGFVDIAKRASQPIEFDFYPLDERFAFFALKAVI
ncbi:MAG: hypothetical protein G8237_05460 [Magnetococcales bacterium]|nr:hypothetical protein [Magnetococcales bacterium]NGZ05786.1 hypothetical protein [Magnetococcales bacterium]